jgi:hypothetical protein
MCWYRLQRNGLIKSDCKQCLISGPYIMGSAAIDCWKDYRCEVSVAEERATSGRGPQETWRRNELIGSKSPVVQ